MNKGQKSIQMKNYVSHGLWSSLRTTCLSVLNFIPDIEQEKEEKKTSIQFYNKRRKESN